MNTKLVIVAGASRGIGKTYSSHFSNQKNTKVIGISRTGRNNSSILNLYDQNEVLKFVKNIDLQGIEHIFYMHAIGIDKFEPDGLAHIDRGDGIDLEVYRSNVVAFKNFANPFLDRIIKEKIPTTVCNIDSISYIYEVKFWQSFRRSKDIVRTYLQSLNYDFIKGLILNIGSTLDEEKNVFARKFADTKDWQTSKELLVKSLPLIELMPQLSKNFVQEKYYKHNPNFRPDYFTDSEKLYKIWEKDMGYEGKIIPLGLRI